MDSVLMTILLFRSLLGLLPALLFAIFQKALTALLMGVVYKHFLFSGQNLQLLHEIRHEHCAILPPSYAHVVQISHTNMDINKKSFRADHLKAPTAFLRYHP